MDRDAHADEDDVSNEDGNEEKDEDEDEDEDESLKKRAAPKGKACGMQLRN